MSDGQTPVGVGSVPANNKLALRLNREHFWALRVGRCDSKVNRAGDIRTLASHIQSCYSHHIKKPTVQVFGHQEAVA